MATNEETFRAFQEIVSGLAEELTDDKFLGDLIRVTDISVILAHLEENFAEAEGFEEAVEAGSWDDLVRAVAYRCAKLIEDRVEEARDQLEWDRIDDVKAHRSPYLAEVTL